MKQKTPLKAKITLKASKNLTAKKVLKKTPKKHTIGWYKKETRKWFNTAIKYRDSVYTGDGWVFDCVTCNTKVLFKDREGRTYRNAQAGHFQPEIYSNTRFDELNVNAQCGMRCNKLGLGEQIKYARAIDSKYGDGVAVNLEKESSVDKQWTIPELEEIIHDSKETVAFYIGKESA